MKKLNRYKFEVEFEVRHWIESFSIDAENLEVAEDKLERLVENGYIQSASGTPILESLDYKLLVDLEQV